MIRSLNGLLASLAELRTSGGDRMQVPILPMTETSEMNSRKRLDANPLRMLTSRPPDNVIR